MMMFAHNTSTINHNYTHTKCMLTTPSSSISCNSPPFLLHFKNIKKKNNFHRCCVSSSSSSVEVAAPPQSIISSSQNKKPSAAEVARTIMELSSVGTFSSINNNELLLSCVGVRFAVDPEDGSPIVSLNPNHFSPSSNNSTLNVQVYLYFLPSYYYFIIYLFI